MFAGHLTRPLALLIGALAALVLLMLVAARTAAADTKVPVQFAMQTAIGPKDAPVRTADYTTADRARVHVQPARWRYYGYYGGYYGAPAPYGAYYAPGPYYTPYYANYPGPYTTYYAPYQYTYFPRRAYYFPAPYYYGW